MHRKYEKIHRLGKEETVGILLGTCYIQEKVDGANTQIWFHDDGTIHVGSRNNDVTAGGGFNGFCEYVKTHEGIQKVFAENAGRYRLYGEWLVRHTISYKETAYKKFYLFDVYDQTTSAYLDIDEIYEFAKKYGIDIVPLRAKLENPSLDAINAFVGLTDFGDKGEGVVIKNMAFKNSFGDFCYAKIVTESFKEDNGVVFGGNNKFSDSYWEVYCMNKYMTLERVKKICQKLEAEVGRLEMKHVPRIMGTAYHDLLTEEVWEIANKVPVLNFDTFKMLCNKKSKQIFVEILTGDISVAHRDNA